MKSSIHACLGYKHIYYDYTALCQLSCGRVSDQQEMCKSGVCGVKTNWSLRGENLESRHSTNFKSCRESGRRVPKPNSTYYTCL